MSSPSPLSEDHFIHSMYTQETMATDNTSTVQVKSQTGISWFKSTDKDSDCTSLDHMPIFGKLIVTREQDHIVGTY